MHSSVLFVLPSGVVSVTYCFEIQVFKASSILGMQALGTYEFPRVFYLPVYNVCYLPSFFCTDFFCMPLKPRVSN